MQTNRKTRPSHVQSAVSKGSAASFRRKDNQSTLVVLILLCLLVPPLGILMTWRARHVAMPVRLGLSAGGMLCTTLIFFFLMRPTDTESLIRPIPATPQLVGYGAVQEPLPTAAGVPAQPGDVVPAAPQATENPTAYQEGGELTDDTIVYAVTNNATSYHLYELCDLQENRRPLTLREALNEGLSPCEKCVGTMG